MSLLRGERERLGLTQGQMEALLWNMPHRTYQDIEAEKRVPPDWVMAAIFERLAKRKSVVGVGEKTLRTKRGKKKNDPSSATTGAPSAPGKEQA
jgi:DNA-binding XRE family transcriptional regulator